MTDPLISVAICTYRRPELLARMLPGVCAQALERASFEVIVVDNEPGARTRAVVAEVARRHPVLRYAAAPRRGLAHARNRALELARGRYVAYLDDDCRVPPGWLSVAQELIERRAPVEFGGPIRGVRDGRPPRWWRSAYEAEHSHVYAPAEGFLPAHQEIFGGNLFLERSAVAAVGGFDPRLGMRGGSLGYGEEWDLHRRLLAARPGHRAYYQPRLAVEHLVRGEKLTLAWRFREQFSRGRDTHLIGCGGAPLHTPAGALGLLLGAAARAVRAGLGALWRRDRGVHRYWQNHVYENPDLNLACRQLGQLRAQWSSAPRWRRRRDPRPACGCRLEST